jgi:hypothetical protein
MLLECKAILYLIALTIRNPPPVRQITPGRIPDLVKIDYRRLALPGDDGARETVAV